MQDSKRNFWFLIKSILAINGTFDLIGHAHATVECIRQNKTDPVQYRTLMISIDLDTSEETSLMILIALDALIN